MKRTILAEGKFELNHFGHPIYEIPTKLGGRRTSIDFKIMDKKSGSLVFEEDEPV